MIVLNAQEKLAEALGAFEGTLSALDHAIQRETAPQIEWQLTATVDGSMPGTST